MTEPVNGYVPPQFLATLAGSTAVAERNTAAAYGRLKAAHPGVYCNPPAGAYWSRQLDDDIHANPAKYGVTDKNLSPVGASPHGLGIRLNIENVTPAVAAQFGFAEFNPYTFTYTGVLSWNEPTIEHNLTTDEVKRVATYLNGRGLGQTTTAAQTGINVLPGEDSSHYYWEVQRAGKLDGVYPQNDLLNGIPGPATYAAELHYRDLTAPAATPAPAPEPAPAPVAAPVVATPTPAPTPVAIAPTSSTTAGSSTPATPPATPTPVLSQKAPKMTPTAPEPLTQAQLQADAAKLDADASHLATVGSSGAPLAGLLAGKPTTRKRIYYVYAGAALVISCGSDVVTYGVVPTNATDALIKAVGLTTSILLKIGAAFGFVAASNTK